MPTLQRMLPDLTDARFCSDNLVELCTNTRESWKWNTCRRSFSLSRLVLVCASGCVGGGGAVHEAEVIAKTIRFSAMLRERMLQRTQH
eukprot:scaffold6540_cov98-Alexandrium_tamarense.AAC.1